MNSLLITKTRWVAATMVVATLGLILAQHLLNPFNKVSFDRNHWSTVTPEVRASMAEDAKSLIVKQQPTAQEIILMLGQPDSVLEREHDSGGNALLGVKTYSYYLSSWPGYGYDDAYLYIYIDTNDLTIGAVINGY